MSGLAPAREVIERALSVASSECVVIVEEGFNADLRFANNTMTTNGVRRDRRVSVVSFHRRAGGVAVGGASASGTVDVASLVGRAEADARNGEPADDEEALIEPSADDEGIDDDPAETSLGVFGGLVDELGEAFRQGTLEDRLLSGFVAHDLSTVYLASSTGLRRRHVQSTGSLELVGRAGGGERSAWSGVGFADPQEIALSPMHERIVERLSWAERRVELPAGRYEVILPPDAVADLVIELAEAMSGRDAEDGGNVFSAAGGRTRLGEQVLPIPFDLIADPHAEGLFCTPFLATSASSRDVSVFDNGAPIEAETFIDKGELARLRYHRAGAKRAGVAFTPPVDDVVLSLPGANATLAELVARTERGLLLTCLWYIREVDPATLLLTGLTRDGVYLVENGEVIGAVNNFRFNESPLDMLGRTLEAGRSERCLSREWNEWMNRTRMPALRVGEFNMSSVSQAN